MYLYRSTGVRVNVLHLCTSVLCFQFRYTYTCVCVCGSLRSWGGARSRFPVSIQPRSRDHLALGDNEPMARKEPLLSALKGERGPLGTCASFFQQRLAAHRYRSDRPSAPQPQPLASRKFIRISAQCSGGSRGGSGRAGVSGPATGPCRAVPGVPPSPSPADHPQVLPLSVLPAGVVLRLREDGDPCTDTSPHLVSLCQLLESILRKGLRRE